MTATATKTRPTKTKPAGPPMIDAATMPTWGSAWSLGMPVNVSHAGAALEHAAAAGCQVPAAIADAVKIAAHVGAWQNDARAQAADAEATWRAQAIAAARNLAPMPDLDLLVKAKAAQDVDGFAAGQLRNLTEESVHTAYRAIRANSDQLIEYGLRPRWADALDQLEAIAARLSPLIIDETTALNAGADAAAAWIDARTHAEVYWATVRARHSLALMHGADARDPQSFALVGRNADQRTLRGEPAHRVAVALHRASTRRALDLWMPTHAEYLAHLEAKAAA